MWEEPQRPNDVSVAIDKHKLRSRSRGTDAPLPHSERDAGNTSRFMESLDLQSWMHMEAMNVA